MTSDSSTDRTWIAGELENLLDAERAFAAIAAARAKTPPDPALGVLYHQLTEADCRHADVVATIATRYGSNPSPRAPTGIGRAWGILKETVGEFGSNAFDQMAWDLMAKCNLVN